MTYSTRLVFANCDRIFIFILTFIRLRMAIFRFKWKYLYKLGKYWERNIKREHIERKHCSVGRNTALWVETLLCGSRHCSVGRNIALWVETLLCGSRAASVNRNLLFKPIYGNSENLQVQTPHHFLTFSF